jgi:hypothetical protein
MLCQRQSTVVDPNPDPDLDRSDRYQCEGPGCRSRSGFKPSFLKKSVIFC